MLEDLRAQVRDFLDGLRRRGDLMRRRHRMDWEANHEKTACYKSVATYATPRYPTREKSRTIPPSSARCRALGRQAARCAWRCCSHCRPELAGMPGRIVAESVRGTGTAGQVVPVFVHGEGWHYACVSVAPRCFFRGGGAERHPGRRNAEVPVRRVGSPGEPVSGNEFQRGSPRTRR